MTQQRPSGYEKLATYYAGVRADEDAVREWGDVVSAATGRPAHLLVAGWMRTAHERADAEAPSGLATGRDVVWHACKLAEAALAQAQQQGGRHG
jgi:hypothetical protein